MSLLLYVLSLSHLKQSLPTSDLRGLIQWGHAMLFLEPICTVVSGLLIIWVAKVRRRENGIKENLDVIMPAEGMLLTGHLLIAVIMSVLILDQIGLTHILQLY